MTEDDDTEAPDLDWADYRTEDDDVLERQDPPTLNEWKAKDLENSPIAAMNRILMGGPLEDFDRFVLTSRLSPELRPMKIRTQTSRPRSSLSYGRFYSRKLETSPPMRNWNSI